MKIANSHSIAHQHQTEKNFFKDSDTKKKEPISGLSEVGPAKIIVKNKLLSWSGNDFSIKELNGDPFGTGLKMKGNVWSIRHRMTLVDGSGNMAAVCLRKFGPGQAFKVYLPNPQFPGQKPSKRTSKGKKLYTYCEVKRRPFCLSQEVIMTGKEVPEFVVSHAGGLGPKKRLVKRGSEPVCLMEGGAWETKCDTYRMTIYDGIDLLLMVCLCAICDKTDADEL